MHIDSLRAILKTYQIGKFHAMIAYMDSKNSLPSMTKLALEMIRYLQEVDVP